ncbi:MAG: FAD-binding protein [Actinobacteria bacterium]|nr:FAD-binding protein [Actinomycetota bacterium]
MISIAICVILYGMAVKSISRALEHLLPPGTVEAPVPTSYLADRTEGHGLRGRADALARPTSAAEVAAVVAWCYDHDVPIVARGGGTGYSGGAVPMGGVVLSLERLTRIRAFDPLLWRIHVEAGVTTADLRRLARENGLLFPPDPGGAEQSQIGGNIATNAGGPHAFKYGVTGTWVMGLEAVVPPGELVRVGGPIRKDVAGYDLKSLLIGSEGTLGVITAAWLRLVPAPETQLPVAGFYADVAGGCAAIERVLGAGLAVAALEYLDGAAVALTARTFPADVPGRAGMLVIAEADGAVDEAARLQRDVLEALAEDAVAVHAPTAPADVAALWRWREGLAFAAEAVRGGKVAEDIVVPIDRLGEAIDGTLAIGARYGLETCSWGHAGDGNIHSTFLVSPLDEDELRRADEAAGELFDLAVRLGGSISGEHGVGWEKRGRLAAQWAPRAVELHEEIKRAFDPKGLLNPGKKLARLP